MTGYIGHNETGQATLDTMKQDRLHWTQLNMTGYIGHNETGKATLDTMKQDRLHWTQ